jgi:hypothetical protein
MGSIEVWNETLREVLVDVVKERAKQDAQFGRSRVTDYKWMGIIGEEFGEFCQAIHEDHPLHRKIEEAIQVAASAIAFVEAVVDGRLKERDSE